MSRFVRAASYLKTLPKPADTYEAVSHLAGIARKVAVPFGAVDTSGNEPVDTWPIRWGTVVDLTHKVFYVMPVNSPAAFWVDVGELDAKSPEILALDPRGKSENAIRRSRAEDAAVQVDDLRLVAGKARH